MRVIVGCEYSQIVCKAFRDRGHDAYSCDILPTEGNPDWHFQEDILELLKRESFDLAIFHPPCTHLCVSGARWFKDKKVEQEAALDFVRQLLDAAPPQNRIREPRQYHFIPNQKARPSYSTVDVRAWGDESNLPVAEKPTPVVTYAPQGRFLLRTGTRGQRSEGTHDAARP
jgi:hypothetical protein